MNKTQELIKVSIENETNKQFGIDVVVEYVSDVTARAQEIERQCGMKFNSVYDASGFTGTFIPTLNDSPYYILIQENRNNMLDVMTAFHEYRHLIEYVQFLKTVFGNNVELLKNSPLNVTFNVYSEYVATWFGVQKYIEIVGVGDLSQKELATQIMGNASKTYQNLQGISNRYQLLVHSMQYLGKIVACKMFVDDIDIQNLVDKMELSKELLPLIIHFFKYENRCDWYAEMDKIMRDFVDGGVDN